jgi:ribonuclease HI
MQASKKLLNLMKLVWVSGHHAIPANEEAYKLAKEWANAVPSDQSVSIPSVVGTEVIRYTLKQEPLKRS